MDNEVIERMRGEATSRTTEELVEVVIQDAIQVATEGQRTPALKETLEETNNFVLARLLVSREVLHKRLGSEPSPLHKAYERFGTRSGWEDF